MGRRSRKKSKKLEKGYHSLDSQSEVVFLKIWLSANGFLAHKRLHLADFCSTGRGVLVKECVKPGDLLLDIPLDITISWATLLMDHDFLSIFQLNKLDVFVSHEKSVTFQELLSFFLLYLKFTSSVNRWIPYIESLPQQYDVPFFLDNDQKQHLDENILTIVNKQGKAIKKAYDIFKSILDSTLAEEKLVNLKDNFNINSFSWAYFTVNTRCVYMSLDAIFNCDELAKKIQKLFNDKPNLALCPYLDMINHSPKVQNETKLVMFDCLEELNQESVQRIRFQLYSKSYFPAYNQLFICYGESHNLKLVCHYGFYIPNNELDFVPFDFFSISEYLKSIKGTLSQKQLKVLHDHNFTNNLYLDKDGLSFNLHAILYVHQFVQNYDKNVLFQILKSSSNPILKKQLVDVIKPLLISRINMLTNSVIYLKSCRENNILYNCISLMESFINILSVNV